MRLKFNRIKLCDCGAEDSMKTPKTKPRSSQQRMVSRRSFEEWIGGPPYERDLYRWPMDETKHAWPGQYKDIAVQLAWEAWCEAANDKIQP